MKEIVRRCQQQTMIPDELAKFLRLPPYDQDLSNQSKIDDNTKDEETKYILEHAPCISIQDYWPWNNDHQGRNLLVLLIFNSEKKICFQKTFLIQFFPF